MKYCAGPLVHLRSCGSDVPNGSRMFEWQTFEERHNNHTTTNLESRWLDQTIFNRHLPKNWISSVFLWRKKSMGLRLGTVKSLRSRSLRGLGKWYLWCWSCRLGKHRSGGCNLKFLWHKFQNAGEKCPELMDKNCHP